jgi:integrase
VISGKPPGTAGRGSFANMEFSKAVAEYVQERLGRVAERTSQIDHERANRWNQIVDDVHNLPENHTVVGRALAAEDKVRLFETAASRDEWMAAYCAAVIAVNTTCRGVEIRSLRWRDLDLAKNVVQVSRSKNEAGHRLIPLNDESLAALSLLRQRAELLGDGQPDRFVFPSCEHNQFDFTRHQKSWRTAWRRLTEASGLKGFRFHDLRHQAIAELAEAGTSDATLQALAGHLSRRLKEHYSHVRMEAKKAAVAGLGTGLSSASTSRVKRKRGQEQSRKKKVDATP